MQDELPLDVLMDMLVFEDLETANEKLAPYHLKARWIDANRGDVEIVSAFGGQVFRIGPTAVPKQRDLFAPDSDKDADIGAIIASAMESTEVETTRTKPPLGEVEPRYQSVFRGAVKEGETDWESKKLEDRFRYMLLNPNSTLNKLLRFYAHGIADTSGDFLVPQTPKTEESPFRHVFADSASDARTVNNTMRHAYRVLNEDEKDAMQAIKDMGLEFIQLLDTLGGSRENSIAKTKMEEAVMWAVKSITK